MEISCEIRCPHRLTSSDNCLKSYSNDFENLFAYTNACYSIRKKWSNYQDQAVWKGCSPQQSSPSLKFHSFWGGQKKGK